jgi:hypothetical protein
LRREASCRLRGNPGVAGDSRRRTSIVPGLQEAVKLVMEQELGIRASARYRWHARDGTDGAIGRVARPQRPFTSRRQASSAISDRGPSNCSILPQFGLWGRRGGKWGPDKRLRVIQRLDAVVQNARIMGCAARALARQALLRVIGAPRGSRRSACELAVRRCQPLVQGFVWRSKKKKPSKLRAL